MTAVHNADNFNLTWTFTSLRADDFAPGASNFPILGQVATLETRYIAIDGFRFDRPPDN
jgi:hypothetical protein